MPTIEVTRRIAADPTSAALLLAAPTAVALWPGVRRVEVAAGPGPAATDRLEVEVELPAALAGADPGSPEHTVAVVHARPPRRTPTSFVLRFGFAADPLPPTRGSLTLRYADQPVSGVAGGPPETDAVLRLDLPADPAAAGEPLTAMARDFLANLGALAERRARAA